MMKLEDEGIITTGDNIITMGDNRQERSGEMKMSLFSKVIIVVIVPCLCWLAFYFGATISVPAVAQNEITIMRKAERVIDSLSDDYAGSLSNGYVELQYEKGKALAILAVAEQLKRIADALERR